MRRGLINLDRGVAKREFLAILYRHAAFRDWSTVRISAGLLSGEEVPVSLAHHQLGMELIGQILRAAEMIGVGVCDEHVFHLLGLEPDLSQAAFDEGLRFTRIVK